MSRNEEMTGFEETVQLLLANILTIILRSEESDM